MAPPDPSTFKPPHTWATYIEARTTANRFKTHASLGLAKVAVSSTYGRSDAYVYHWDGDQESWVEVGMVPQGTDPYLHELWTNPIYRKRSPEPVSQRQVDRAVESIMETLQEG